jgi:hypothetical protein
MDHYSTNPLLQLISPVLVPVACLCGSVADPQQRSGKPEPEHCLRAPRLRQSACIDKID